MKSIELLSPARTADIGIEAVRHGADAVYIGAAEFGARTAAGNSVDDIRRLCDFAHTFGARVYVTTNTILYDAELRAAERLIGELYDAGADALIVQDMALLRLDLPPIALHASTQTDIRTAEKAQFLERAGFSQLVLARELPLDTIRQIRAAVKAELEVFVHGALCVSYSGQCYASEHCFGRSANRGRCAQFCRLAFDLEEGRRTLVRDRHLLSLRDLNRSAALEELLDAGVTSLKIEGRLKDAAYVKNVTAHYRQALDAIIARRQADFRRTSFGESAFAFTPDVSKSFNRGFTDYFLHGRTDVSNPISPKAMGEPLGRVKRVEARSFSLDGATVSAGDGLCFVNTDGKLEGFRVNKREGSRIFPAQMPPLQTGTQIYRNHDAAFEKQLARPTAERKLRTSVSLRPTPDGFALTLADESGCCTTLRKAVAKQQAQTPQADNVRRQLTRLGNTPFAYAPADDDFPNTFFIPSSVLAEWRREAVDALLAEHRATYRRPPKAQARAQSDTPRAATTAARPKPLTYTANVANAAARAFYEEQGLSVGEPAFELQQPRGAVLMTCKHCVRYALQQCPKHHGAPAPREPWALRLPDGRRFPLRFDCARCEMQVMADD